MGETATRYSATASGGTIWDPLRRDPRRKDAVPAYVAVCKKDLAV